MKRGMLWAAALALCVGATVVAAAAGPYAKYLTVTDVEKVTGLSGVTVTETPTSLRFSNRDGKTILEARFSQDRSVFTKEVEKNAAVYQAVADVGEKAAITSPARPYRLTFVKGKQCVIVEAVPQFGRMPLTRDQLIAVAKLVAARL